jgi:hypothetical protein
MQLKTKNSFDYFILLVVITLVFLIFYGLVRFNEYFSFSFENMPFYPNAAILASGVKISEGINEFNGTVYNHSLFIKSACYIALNIFLFFVLLPAVTFYFFRKILTSKEENKISVWNRFNFYFFLAFATAYVLYLGFSLGANYQTNNKIVKSNIQESLKDELSYSISEIYFRTIELSLLDTEKSLKNKKIDAAIIQSLDFKKDTATGNYFRKISDGKFDLVCVPNLSDSTFTLFGIINNADGRDLKYQNVNGSKGKFQNSIKLSLFDDFITKYDN